MYSIVYDITTICSQNFPFPSSRCLRLWVHRFYKYKSDHIKFRKCLLKLQGRGKTLGEPRRVQGWGMGAAPASQWTGGAPAAPRPRESAPPLPRAEPFTGCSPSCRWQQGGENMFPVVLVLAGLGALAASGPGKPPETQLPWVPAEAGLPSSRAYLFLPNWPNWPKTPGSLPTLWLLLPRHPGNPAVLGRPSD